MEKRKIRFKKNHTLRIDGREIRFVPGDEVEVEEKEGIELIRRGIALPGLQHGAAVSNIFEGGNQK
jgi:hypothetical protein